jgi:DNA polymerase-1
MDGQNRLIIIDGHSLMHRAFHALPPLTNKKKELVNAVYGFLLALFRAIKEFRPNYIAVTFDLPSPTFRHQIFAGYKATRPKAPEEFYSQIPRVKDLLKIFNIPFFNILIFL